MKFSNAQLICKWCSYTIVLFIVVYHFNSVCSVIVLYFGVWSWSPMVLAAPFGTLNYLRVVDSPLAFSSFLCTFCFVFFFCARKHVCLPSLLRTIGLAVSRCVSVIHVLIMWKMYKKFTFSRCRNEWDIFDILNKEGEKIVRWITITIKIMKHTFKCWMNYSFLTHSFAIQVGTLITYKLIHTLPFDFAMQIIDVR